ncbi:SDR family NAD(P)-dependent oxidoreductase [Congregibacter litoralis]|uniref:Short-chain dehydrogenase n=1 Tax=Congregibacter litoralis KT71 TaxID=314285 RepID=A4AA95_9GAMM|nr:SDR family NAD(P)-dependent oxidoreductase [Congregibacter litoralis]EAQ96972.1 Dehydrogenase with unknown specificity [Congregibacter litoralis KT71]
MAEDDNSAQALVVGGRGGIGSAMATQLAQDGRFDTVWTVSRNASDAAPGLRSLETEHDEAHIKVLSEQVLAESPRLSRVVIALGTLHGEGYGPEKSLEALEGASMEAVYRVNCMLPLLWLAALAPGLRKNPDCRIAVLSARVGSIGDNGLGGWYSYRSAKAALNMGLKCASIELARRAKGVKLMAFHPGTVDTPLSEPFQRGIPEGKLFTPAFVAERLSELLDSHPADGELSYLDWAGKTIPW